MLAQLTRGLASQTPETGAIARPAVAEMPDAEVPDPGFTAAGITDAGITDSADSGNPGGVTLADLFDKKR